MPENPALAEPFRKAGCDIILQPRSRGNFDLASVWRVYRLLRQLKGDVFHCYNDHTSPLLGAALAKVPVRIWSKLAMSPYYEKNTQPRGVHCLALSTRLSCALATRILARSEAVKQELIAEGSAPAKISVVPVDVDISLYGTAPASPLRQELGYSSTDIIITSVGRAIPVKGWDVLLSSFEAIAPQHSDAHLLLVGEIPSDGESAFAESLQARVRHMGLSERVRFLGRWDDIPGVLSMSDLFVLPSRSEGQPGALVEAMATGLPCVGTQTGGIPELIEDGQNGLLVRRESAEDLTRAMTRLIQNRTLRETLGQRAKVSAKRFDLAESTNNLFALYAGLLDGLTR